MEIWKDIPGYEGFYQVSNLGRVKSLFFNRIKILSQKIRKDGYYEVTLHKNNKGSTIKTHQLVAMAFLGHIRCGFNKVVDHIDNDKSNNNLGNLQIVSNRLNTSKDKHPNKKYSKLLGVSKYKKSGKYTSQIRIKGKLIYLGSFDRDVDAHKAYMDELYKIKTI